MLFHKFSKNQGITLLEILLVINIIAILASLSIPSFFNNIADYRLKSAVRELVSDIQKSRAEAIKYNSNVIIDFNPGNYTNSGEVGSYKIFVDDGRGNGIKNNFIHESDETFIANNKNMPKDVSLYDAKFSTVTYTGFKPSGLLIGNRFGSIKLRNNKSKYYKISINRAGSINTDESNDGNF